MAQPPVFPPFSMISPQFIAPNTLEIIVEKYPCRNIVITDINHIILLKVKPFSTAFHRQRLLLDANDKPIATLQEKSLSLHGTWNVFKGESKADSDMIFSTKSDSMRQLYKTNVSVRLANNTMSSSDDCDLKIKRNWSKGNCTIYMGDSSTAIAQMHKQKALKYATDKWTVTIQPNMDYAGVVVIFAIVDALENRDDK